MRKWSPENKGKYRTDAISQGVGAYGKNSYLIKIPENDQS